MVTANPGPAGGTLSGCPVIQPLTISAATSSAGLPDWPEHDLAQVAWWRLDVPPGPNRPAFFDAGSYSTPATGGAIKLVFLQAPLGSPAPTDPNAVDLFAFSSFPDANYRLASGASYFIGVGLAPNDPGVAVPGVTYRLLVSDFGAVTTEQLPDVEATWGYLQAPGAAQGSTGTAPTPDPLGVYNLHTVTSLHDPGPAYRAHVGTFGEFANNDVGLLDGAPVGGGRPSMTQAHGFAEGYTLHMHLPGDYQIHHEEFEGAGDGTPVMPQTTVVSSTTSGGPGGVGYEVGATPTQFAAVGNYSYTVTGESLLTRVSGFTDATGRSGNSPEWDAMFARHPGASATINGPATLQALAFKPDLLDSGQEPTTGAAASMPVAFVDWSPEWRTPFVSNTNPLTEDPLYQPRYWGPTNGTRRWQLIDGQAVLGDVDDPDPYNQQRNAVCWLGSDASDLAGMAQKPDLDFQWTDVTDLADVLAHEATPDPGGNVARGLCVAVVPRPMHQHLSPDGYGLDDLHNGPWQTTAKTYNPKLVFRTRIRPASVTFIDPPEVPTVALITATEGPWLRALQRTDGLGAGGPPRAVQKATQADSLRAGTAVI